MQDGDIRENKFDKETLIFSLQLFYKFKVTPK